jgi:hypothetical protein
MGTTTRGQEAADYAEDPRFMDTNEPHPLDAPHDAAQVAAPHSVRQADARADALTEAQATIARLERLLNQKAMVLGEVTRAFDEYRTHAERKVEALCHRAEVAESDAAGYGKALDDLVFADGVASDVVAAIRYPDGLTEYVLRNGRRFEEVVRGEFSESAPIPGTRAALAREGA